MIRHDPLGVVPDRLKCSCCRGVFLPSEFVQRLAWQWPPREERFCYDCWSVLAQTLRVLVIFTTVWQIPTDYQVSNDRLFRPVVWGEGTE
jgi:hypothetical protein